jgi:hypothetical protein
MMIGTIRWNLTLGAIGFVFTFLLSVFNNLFLTTFVRSFYCFMILFIVGFIVRWLLGTLAGLNHMTVEADGDGQDAMNDKGSTVDFSTPDEQESLNQLLKQQIDNPQAGESFSPLEPPKLASKMEQNPEELAKALRRLIED